MCDGNVGNETGGPYVITESNRSLQLCQSGIEGFIWGFKVRVQDDVLEFVSKMFDLESCSTWSNFNLKSILRRELSCTVNFFHFLRRWVSKLWSTDTTQKQKFTTVAKSDLNVEKIHSNAIQSQRQSFPQNIWQKISNSPQYQCPHARLGHFYLRGPTLSVCEMFWIKNYMNHPRSFSHLSQSNNYRLLW